MEIVPANARFKTMSHLFGRITFYPSLWWNIALEKISNRDWYNRIDDHVILGALPLRSVLAKLREEENVTAVLSVNMPYELDERIYPKQNEFTEHGISFKNIQVQDYSGIPTPQQICEALEFIESERCGTVYVHCKAGRYRSATIACCYLIKSKLKTPKQAASIVRQARPHVVLLERNFVCLEAFHRSVSSDKEESEQQLNEEK